LQKLGVLGGTFDPVHAGHLALAREAMRQAGLDGVILLPMARPVQREAEASPEDRLQMCRLAARNMDSVFISQSGMASGVKYTVDTMGLLRREYPDAAFSLIVGGDKLISLPYWHQAEQLFAQVDFLCYPRGGVDPREAIEKAEKAGARIKMLTGGFAPYSSTMIRALTARYEDAPGLDPEVLRYMAERGLYQRDDLPKLKTMMNPRRFQHTLGVRKEAVRLAIRYGLPVQKAALAGLLHDCAKGMSLKEMKKIAVEQHLTDDENILSSGALLHAPVGAYLAKKEFGVQDEEVLNAIRSHTVGRKGMSLLEMCIFVADATEEGREDYEGLSDLRRLADLSLPAAVYRSFELTQDYLRKNKRPFDSSSLETMAYLEKLMTPEEKRLAAL